MAGALATLAAIAAARDDLTGALQSISARDLHAHLLFLSHDLLEGRASASRGADLAALYIASQLMRSGLEPVRGSYFQPVPVLGSTVQPAELAVEFETRGRRLSGRYPAELVIAPGVEDSLITLSSEVVFVGYGVRAPEYRWDDFKGRKLAGKTLLVLVNEPPATPEEPTLFAGRALTYYGRWTYKLEQAERQGAAAVLLIHTTESAGYPWGVVQSSWTGEQLSLPRDAEAPPPLALEGWLTRELAQRVLAAAGLDLEQLAGRAARRDFRPVSTGVMLHARVPARLRRLETTNVAGLLSGRDPAQRNQAVVFSAHFDHLGIGRAVDGDSVYNGAYDNASGVSLLLEIAEAFARLEPRPERSVLFLATTAEEAGLLGAEYYVRHPLFPLAHTLANLNLDGASLWGETDDLIAIGSERSTLGRIVEARARSMGLLLTPDAAPEKGFFFRSDQFPFARAGVPAIGIRHGTRFRGRSEEWGLELLERYDAEHYHQPSDEYDPGADLAGAVQQARVAFLVGYDIAQMSGAPEWYEGAEFRSAREKAVRGR